jgi:hypothetical protein
MIEKNWIEMNEKRGLEMKTRQNESSQNWRELQQTEINQKLVKTKEKQS